LYAHSSIAGAVVPQFECEELLELHIEEDDLPDFVDWEVEGAVNIPRDHTTNTHKVRTPAP
jgi:hypothetical protein